jgi:hypothetical protein
MEFINKRQVQPASQPFALPKLKSKKAASVRGLFTNLNLKLIQKS